MWHCPFNVVEAGRSLPTSVSSPSVEATGQPVTDLQCPEPEGESAYNSGFLPRYAPVRCAHPYFLPHKQSTGCRWLLCCRVAGVPSPWLLQPLLQVRQRQPHPGDLRERPPLQRGHRPQRNGYFQLLTLYSYYMQSLRKSFQLLHCNENSIDVFWELHGLSPNFHIHVSVSDLDLYIPRMGPHISCSRIGRLIVGIYKSLTDTWMWKSGLWPHNSFPGNICLKFSVLVLCSFGWVRPETSVESSIKLIQLLKNLSFLLIP